MRYYFALLNPNETITLNTVPNAPPVQSTDSSRPVKTKGRAQLWFSQSSSSISNLLSCSHRLSQRVSFPRMLPSLRFFCFLFYQGTIFLIFTAKYSKISMKGATTRWRSELVRKLCSFTIFEEMNRDVETCLPIDNNVFVALKVSPGHKVIQSLKLLTSR